MRAINQAVGHEVFQLYAGDLDRRIAYRPAEDRLLLFHALHAASGEVCVSYARQGQSGKEQLPSPFLTELARLSQKSIRHVPTSSVPSWEKVATEATLRQRVALETLARSEFRQEPRLPGHASLKAHFAHEPWFEDAAVMKKMDDERLVFFSNADASAGGFSGRISSAPSLEFLNARLRFDTERPLSASQLGQFSGCAYKGFLSYVLGLREEDEPAEELDARGLGSFWHQVLEKLMPRLQTARLLKAPWEELPPTLIDDVIDEAAREYETNEHTGHPLLWQLVKPRTRKMLRTLLREEHGGLPFNGAEPSATELSFGKKTSEPPWQDICLPAAFPGETPVYFTGTIDRLDEGSQQVNVLDYKLKNLKKGDLIKELLTDSFQIPLYLMAVRDKLSAQKVDGGWLSLKSGEVFKLSKLLEEERSSIEELLATDEKSRAEARESGKLNFANAVHDVLGRLRQGDVSPRPTGCDYCSYQSACRISERRVTEGDGDE
jgi:ATP-dependent helicase/DNAse subunit B